MQISESQRLDGDETCDTQVSDFRKWVCGVPFSEIGNKYEETFLGKENQECSSINSNFDEIIVRHPSEDKLAA